MSKLTYHKDKSYIVIEHGNGTYYCDVRLDYVYIGTVWVMAGMYKFIHAEPSATEINLPKEHKLTELKKQLSYVFEGRA